MPDGINFNDFANGLLGVIIVALAWLGRNGILKLGQPKQPDRSGDVEVAGALIDKKMADQIIAANDANTKAVIDKTRAVEENTAAIKRMGDMFSEEMRVTRNRIMELGNDIRDLR